MSLFPLPFQGEVVHDLYRPRETAHVIEHVLILLLYRQRSSQVGIYSNNLHLHSQVQSVVLGMVEGVLRVTQRIEYATAVLCDRIAVESETRDSRVMDLFQQVQRQGLFRRYMIYR